MAGTARRENEDTSVRLTAWLVLLLAVLLNLLLLLAIFGSRGESCQFSNEACAQARR